MVIGQNPSLLKYEIKILSTIVKIIPPWKHRSCPKLNNSGPGRSINLIPVDHYHAEK